MDNEKGNFIWLFIANNHVYNHTSKTLSKRNQLIIIILKLLSTVIKKKYANIKSQIINYYSCIGTSLQWYELTMVRVCKFWYELTWYELTSYHATGINRGRVNTGCVFLVSQMTHIQSLTNATGINRGRLNTGCVFLLSQMTHIQSLTNAAGINRGRVNTGCVFLVSQMTHTITYQCYRHQQR